MDKRCCACRFYDADGGSICRRNAPRAAVLRAGEEGFARSVWPEVFPSSWCGEYAPATPAFEQPSTVGGGFNDVSLESDVSKLILSQRAENAIVANGIATVGDLVRYTRRDLHALRWMGSATIDEIERSLRREGLSLAQDARTPGSGGPVQ